MAPRLKSGRADVYSVQFLGRTVPLRSRSAVGLITREERRNEEHE